MVVCESKQSPVLFRKAMAAVVVVFVMLEAATWHRRVFSEKIAAGSGSGGSTSSDGGDGETMLSWHL